MSLLLLFHSSVGGAAGLELFVEMDFGAGWEDVSSDVIAVEDFELSYGITGHGPLDRTAGTGRFNFSLRNDAGCSGGVLGYYSPQSSHKRAGFTFGIPVRVRLSFEGISRTKFVGKLYVIDPVPGQHGLRRVYCTAYDFMYELAEQQVRSIVPQINQTETQLIAAVLASLPATVQPVSTTYDAALDSYPFAFDDMEGGVQALTALNKVVVSAWGRLVLKGNGTLAYFNRQNGILRSVDVTLEDADMTGLDVPSSLTNVYDIVRVTAHPKTLSPTNVAVLCALPLTDTPDFAAGETRDFWMEYRNPDNLDMKAGGTDFQTVDATTDFLANTLADGTGTNVTASFTVVASLFASTAKFVVTNGTGAQAFLTKLQARGRGIYDIDPVTMESAAVGGSRLVPVNLPYQNDSNNAQDLADFIRNEYEVVNNQVESVTFFANRTAALTRHALDREPGDLIVVRETATGIDAGVLIHSVTLRLRPPLLLECEWGLAPRVAGNQWILGDSVLSVLGTSTILGYA